MTDNKKLDKLRKLLALARNNPNKSEAMAAVDMLQERAAEYGMTMEEVEAAKSSHDNDDQFGSRSAYSGEKQYGFVDQFLWKTIARFCCCKVGVGRDSDGDLTIVYFGHDVDVELAFWLRSTIKAAMSFEWGVYRDFVMDKKSNTTSAMKSFHLDFADQVRERMEAAVRRAPTTSTDLVVCKNALVDQKALEAGFAEAVGGKADQFAYDAAAGAAGRSAGGRVDIGRGVSGRAGGARMIGK